MVEIDWVCGEDFVAVGCSGVYVIVNFSGVEGGVVVVADGEGGDVRGCRL